MATALTSGRSFFEFRLLFLVGQRVLGSWSLAALLEALQIVPAPLDLHRTAEPLGHPVGHRSTRPVLAPVGRRPGERRSQLLPARAADSLHPRVQDGSGTPRVR